MAVLIFLRANWLIRAYTYHHNSSFCAAQAGAQHLPVARGLAALDVYSYSSE